MAQQQVDSKSNEIPAVRPMLRQVDLKGMIVTTDALHTQKELAQFLEGSNRFMVTFGQPVKGL